MMDASLYFDGELQVPLSQFSSDYPESRYEIKISNMAELLQNSECALEGYCRSKTRDKILRGLNSTPDEWRGMESSPLNAQLSQELCFVAEPASISSARTTLGDDFLCTVRLHCTPPKHLVKLTDGEIFQNVRFYYKNDRAAAAQEWIKSLSGPKQANLISLLGCPAIMDALDRLLRFPGLWFGLQLGNWAKHLAAHVDQCIVNYLSHIYNFYSTILDGFESMSDQLDEITIAQLQHRSPSWSSQDIAYIEKGFRSGTLFPGIRSSHIRNTVKERIKAFTGIIPSIITFHENMKYLTIGTKILERCIELPRQVEIRRGSRVRPDLFNKLKADWNLDEMKVQADHNAFISSPFPPDADLCCIQLVIAAIRHFASLNVYEAPLMDSNRKTMSAAIDLETQSHLCWIATKLGFNNQNIQAKASERNPASWPDKSQKPLHTWRAGKPFREVFLYLEQHSFLLQIKRELKTTSKTPSPLCVQGDILSAFFNLDQYEDTFGGVGPDEQPPWGPSFHAKASFEAFLKLRAQNTTVTNKDAKKDSRFDKSEPGSSKGHKDKSPALNFQRMGQEQRNGGFQSTGLRENPNGRVINRLKPIKGLQSQRQPTLRIASLDSTVSGIFFNQQRSKEQLMRTSNVSSEEEDLYSATPRNASPSIRSNDKAGDMFPSHARLASVSTNTSGINIAQQGITKQNTNASNTSSSEEYLYSTTPRNVSPSNSGNEKGDIFPRHARLASVSTNASGIGINQQENTKQNNKTSSSSPQEDVDGVTPPDPSPSHSSNDEADDEFTRRFALVSTNASGIGINQQENTKQRINTTSISSLGDSYYATPRGSTASSIQAGPRKDSNSAGLPTSTIHAYNNKTASIVSNISGIEIGQLEDTEQSVGRPNTSSQDGLHNTTSSDSAASTIQARLGKDDNFTGLSSLKRHFQDKTSKNGSDKKLEYPSLHSLESRLLDTPMGNVQHTKELRDINLNDTQASKIQSPSMHSPNSHGIGKAKFGKRKAEVNVNVEPFNSKAEAYKQKKELIKKSTRSEVRGSTTGKEGGSASILSEPQPGHAKYPNLDDAKAKLPSTSAESFNKVGLEKELYDPKQPLPRLSANLKELQEGHHYDKFTESSRDRIHAQDPPPPQSSSTATPGRQGRRRRPGPIDVGRTHNAEDWLVRPSLDGETLVDPEVDSNSTNRPKERRSYDDSGSEIANRHPQFPPEKIQLLEDHSPTSIYGRREYERSYSRNVELQHKLPWNKPPYRLKLPLSAPPRVHVPMKYYDVRRDLAYEFPLFGWHKIREDQLSELRQEHRRTIKPRGEQASPSKVRTLNDRSLAVIEPVDQTDDPNVDSNRTSRTESVDFAELSPHNLNRNVGSGIFDIPPDINPSPDDNIRSSQDNYHQDGSSSNVFTNALNKDSPPSDDIDMH